MLQLFEHKHTSDRLSFKAQVPPMLIGSPYDAASDRIAITNNTSSANQCNRIGTNRTENRFACNRPSRRRAYLHTFRELIDQGSHISMITEQAAQLLCLPRQRANIDIIPVGQSTPISPNGCAKINLTSIHQNVEPSTEVTVFILPTM